MVINMKKFKLYLTLFSEMFRLSAFTFGGGYVIVPLMQRSFVDKLGWIGEKEMLDYTAIAQSSPGAVAINTAIMVGMHVGGALGAAVSLFAAILPPLIIITVISFFYEAFADNTAVAAVLRGMRAGVCAVILDAVITLIEKMMKDFSRQSAVSWLRVAMIPASFLAVFALKINAAIVILAGALIGIVITLITKKAGEKV